MISLKDKNILVTGGTGFVGSHLIEELVKRSANVVSTYLTVNPHSYFFTQKLQHKVTMAQVDVCNFNTVFDLITKCRIDYIFHFAAQPLIETAYFNPKQTLYTNIIGTVNILESARLFPHVKGVIVASSDKAYGKMDKTTVEESAIKYKETDSLKGDHPYEVSKSSTDLIANSYYKTYGLPVVITRFGNIYGEGDLNFSRIIPGIMKAIIRGEILEIRSNGKYVRDYLYVKDVVNGYLLLASNINKLKGEAFNFGSNETLSVIELIKLVEKHLNYKIKYKISNSAVNEIPHQSLDFSKINTKLGWLPKYQFKSTIKRVYRWNKIFFKAKDKLQ